MSPPGVFYETPQSSGIRRKRSHSGFLQSHSRSQSPWTGRPQQRMDIASGSAPNFLEPPFNAQAPPLVRFEGDGYDFRRPIMSTSVAGPSSRSMPVIDLTEDDSDVSQSFVNSRQLPPLSFTSNTRRHPPSADSLATLNTSNLGGRMNPVDLDHLPDAVTDSSSSRATAENTQRDRSALHHEDPNDSDDSDVVFVSERALPPSHNTNNSDNRWANAANQSRDNAGGWPAQSQNGSSRFRNLGPLGDIISNNTLNFFQLNRFSALGFGPTLRPPTVSAGFGLGFEHPRPNQSQNNLPDLDFGVMTDRPIRQTRRQNFPLQMDFEARAFELYDAPDDSEIMFEGPVRRGGQRESPPYKAPSAAPEGFTRKIEEDTMVVCPNCNDELGRREYEDLKKQVWVVKACGHVYCGECTKNRFVSKGKSDPRHSTFKRCVVDGCDKMVSSKTAMLQIYL